MFKYTDLTGNKHGEAKILGFSHIRNSNRIWKLKCFCGKIYETSTRQITHGKSTHCGCNSGLVKVGMKFGIGEVKKYLGIIKRNKNWLLKCKCGNFYTTRTNYLVSGHTKSCGCLRGFNGYEGLSGMQFAEIQRRARNLKLEFDLDTKYLWDLFIEQDGECALSGCKLILAKTAFEFKKHKWTASLDRIDSSKGYVKGNVQWVHKIINKMKSNLIQDDFIQVCTDIYHFNKGN